MARPERNDVDYFPFLCKEGKAMFYIEQTYGNDGYAAWVKILRQLSVTNYHYLNLQDQVEFMFLSSKCRVSQDTLNCIIKDLCDLGEFNKELWFEHRILFNEKLISTLKDAYSSRNNNCITLDGLLVTLEGLGIRKLSNSDVKRSDNPQSKVKQSKVKNIYREFDHLSLTDSDFESIEKSGWTKYQIDTILDAIQNHKKNKNYSSLKLTCISWLKRQFPQMVQPEVTTEVEEYITDFFTRPNNH